MTDLVQRLRTAGATWTLATQAADRIEQLEQRLEIDSQHQYDGIDCRDATIRELERENAELAAMLTAATGWKHAELRAGFQKALEKQNDQSN